MRVFTWAEGYETILASKLGGYSRGVSGKCFGQKKTKLGKQRGQRDAAGVQELIGNAIDIGLGVIFKD